jgi:hypothetical protein
MRGQAKYPLPIHFFEGKKGRDEGANYPLPILLRRQKGKG